MSLIFSLPIRKIATALSCNESRHFTADKPEEWPQTRLLLARVWAESSTVLSLPMGGATPSLWTPPWGLAECLWAPGLSGPPSPAPDVFLNCNTHHEPQEELELCWASVFEPTSDKRFTSAAGVRRPPLSSHKPMHTPPTPPHPQPRPLTLSTEEAKPENSNLLEALRKNILPFHLTFFFWGGGGGGTGFGWVEWQNTVTKPNFLKRQAFFFLCYLSELARLQ